MKKYILSFVVCSLFAFSSFAEETPEKLADNYFKLLGAQKWTEMGDMFDPKSLAEFREMMSFMSELPEEASAQVLGQFFGAGTTSEDMKKMSDKDFFSRFLKGIMGQAAAMGQLNFKKIEVLGSVPEGDDVKHVVTRSHMEIGEMSMEAMEVISCRKSDAGWKVLMQGKMKGMAQQLKNAFGK